MPIYHVGMSYMETNRRARAPLITGVNAVLFKLKPDVTAQQVDNFRELVLAMQGQVPGLLKISFGEPLPISASRALGFNVGIVAIFDKADTIPVYAAHSAHQQVIKMRYELCTDILAYDMEFED